MLSFSSFSYDFPVSCFFFDTSFLTVLLFIFFSFPSLLNTSFPSKPTDTFLTKGLLLKDFDKLPKPKRISGFYFFCFLCSFSFLFFSFLWSICFRLFFSFISLFLKNYIFSVFLSLFFLFCSSLFSFSFSFSPLFFEGTSFGSTNLIEMNFFSVYYHLLVF